MLSTPPLKRAQMKYQAKNVQLRLPMEVYHAESETGFVISADL